MMFGNPLFLDIETTGLDPAKDEILEVGIINVKEQIILSRLLKPIKNTSWPEAQAINKITPEMVQTSQEFRYAKKVISDKLKDRVVYIWNAPFELSFLKAQLKDSAVICAMEEFGDYIKRVQPQNVSESGRYKMQDVAKALGIETKHAHTAIGDARTMLAILNKIRDKNFPPPTFDFTKTPAYKTIQSGQKIGQENGKNNENNIAQQVLKKLKKEAAALQKIINELEKMEVIA